MKRPDRKDKKYWFKLGSVDQCRWGQYAIDLNDYIDHLESQLKEVKELLYKSKHNSQMSISEFEQFLYDRNKYLTQNKEDETKG